MDNLTVRLKGKTQKELAQTLTKVQKFCNEHDIRLVAMNLSRVWFHYEFRGSAFGPSESLLSLTIFLAELYS
jgi:hypothetical protein